MNKEALIQWYKENGIIDVIEEKTFNHFNVPCETLVNKNNSIKKIEGVVVQKKSNPDILKAEVVVENKIKVKAETQSGEKIEINSKETSKYNVNLDKQEFNFNYIYQNLANKYRNDNMKLAKEKILTLEDCIKKARELADKSNTIDELKTAVENFDGYLDIKNLATNTVFGEGNRNSKIMIIGEAPGNNEDLEGRPFCGQSGELLNSMFKSIGLNREDLYITNTLFWRPPGNRTPTDDEINICRPFVEKHIFLINPELIIFMGATALKDLIKTDLTITKARKQIFEYTNEYLNGKTIKTTPLFHPSYLLRQSSKKKDAWSDLLFVKSII